MPTTTIATVYASFHAALMYKTNIKGSRLTQ